MLSIQVQAALKAYLGFLRLPWLSSFSLQGTPMKKRHLSERQAQERRPSARGTLAGLRGLGPMSFPVQLTAPSVRGSPLGRQICLVVDGSSQLIALCSPTSS